MASRKETNDRRQALHEELRLSCRNGSLPLGEPLPPVRELAGRYGVSHRIVSDAIRILTDEGLLYTVPRVGTFVGSPDSARDGLFLCVGPANRPGSDPIIRLQSGFEEQISKLGGNCLCLDWETVTRTVATSRIPLRALGVFHLGHPPALTLETPFFSREAPHVVFTEGFSDRPITGIGSNSPSDAVSFDNQGAGQQVTQYLLRQGHRRIAFLGLHASSGPGDFQWSRQRHHGWESSLRQADLPSSGLDFLPATLGDNIPIHEQVAVSRETAASLVAAIEAGEVDAVVTVNVHAAHGLFEALAASQLPEAQWPVVTTFGMGDANVSMMTSMLLPYEQIGREAADLLWSRTHGGYQGSSRSMAVPMRLITRLTCRPAWKVSPEAAIITSLGTQFA